MTRTVSAPTLAEAGAGVSQPLYFLSIDWAASATYLCTHSTQDWNGQSWLASGLDIRFDKFGRPTDVTISDPLAAYRTLAASDGISDRAVRVWKAYIGALGIDDPVALFDGYADGYSWASGQLRFALDYAMSGMQFSPRERIGPALGINFVGAPGTRIPWAGQIVILEPR